MRDRERKKKGMRKRVKDTKKKIVIIYFYVSINSDATPNLVF